jgi:release factor glutamine methyltransferase
MKSIREVLKEGEAFLESCGIADAAVDAWLLLEYVTGISRTVFLLEGGQPMAQEHCERYQELLQKRGSHIPLQHLTGEQEFMGFSFRVNEHVLIPRQDTEILVEEALKYISPGSRVLDLCTGSGCIAVSIAKLCGRRNASLCSGQRTTVPRTTPAASVSEAVAGDTSDLSREALAATVDASELSQEALAVTVTVDAADISQEALAVASDNAARLGADVHFIRSDLFAEIPGRYDVIVSNPPYIRTAVIEELEEEVRCHEPYGALDGREDGLYFYRAIVSESRAHLRGNGMLLFEIGYDQAKEVSELMAAAGFAEIRTVKDLAGLDRVVLGRYTDTLE